jgi:hypothetical protein
MIAARVLLFAFSLLFTSPLVSEADSIPQSIGSLSLMESRSGEEARQEIDRLHGKQIDFKRGYIGTYGGEEGKAKLWVSEYGSEEEAFKAVEKMAQGVRANEEAGFWHFREIPIGGLEVYFVVGMGQAHYFFQRGIKAIWLAVDPPLAKQAIRDLMSQIP